MPLYSSEDLSNINIVNIPTSRSPSENLSNDVYWVWTVTLLVDPVPAKCRLSLIWASLPFNAYWAEYWAWRLVVTSKASETGQAQRMGAWFPRHSKAYQAFGRSLVEPSPRPRDMQKYFQRFLSANPDNETLSGIAIKPAGNNESYRPRAWFGSAKLSGELWCHIYSPISTREAFIIIWRSEKKPRVMS